LNLKINETDANEPEVINLQSKIEIIKNENSKLDQNIQSFKDQIENIKTEHYELIENNFNQKYQEFQNNLKSDREKQKSEIDEKTETLLNDKQEEYYLEINSLENNHINNRGLNLENHKMKMNAEHEK